ncbi:uncharacterized protein [Mytilus edulis]|uniref:uncharacterized protein n=1 Tax=Mytilus edulis TaxID=6550 RepID=UPI0039F0880E
MTNILHLLILFYCHIIEVSGVLKWTVIGKVTDYGQNVTLFCHVPNCCPKDSGWDRWTPVQRTLYIDVKTGRANKKYDGKTLKEGYTLVIQNLTKDDLNVSYSCLYGVTLGEIKFLQKEDVFMYRRLNQLNATSKLAKGEIAGIIVGFLVVVAVLVFLVYCWKHRNNSNGGICATHCIGRKRLCHKCRKAKSEDRVKLKPHEISSLKETILFGEEIRKYVRIHVIGKNGVGKTCLVRRLLNQTIKDVESTDGIDINRICHIKESDLTWSIYNGESEMKKIGRRILQAVDIKRKRKKVVSDKRRPSEDNRFKTENSKTQKKSEDRIAAERDEHKALLSKSLTEVKETLEINDDSVTKSTINTPAVIYHKRDDNKLDVTDTMNYDTDKPMTSTSANRNSYQITEAVIDKMDEIISYVKKEKDSMTNQGLIECGIWDFAGEKEYYATHQTFLTPHAIYLLVADIRDDLKPIEYDKQFNSDSSGDYIDFWLDSIHCYSKDGKNNKSETKGPPVIMADTCTDKAPDKENGNKVKRPPVIMVCTCIDKVPNKEAKKKEFKDKFLKIFGCQEKGNHTDGNIHFISNVESPEDDFTELRAHISKIAKHMDFFSEKLPTKWIQLENTLAVLLDLAEKGKISYCEKYENTEKIAHKLSIEKDKLLLFLNYQHKIGNIIFFDDKRDYIILQPKWLVNCFKCLICDDDKNLCTTEELYDLRHKGMLSDDVIDKLFSKVPELMNKNSKTHILDVMEKFDIIVKPKSLNTYYIPCMITQILSLESIKEAFKVKNQHCTPWLVVEFQFLPISYYYHILFMYIKEKTVCKEKTPIGDGPPAIYAGKVVVYLDETKQRKLVICFSRNAISLQIWNNNDMDVKEYRKIVAEICNKIEDLETKLDNKLQYEIKSKCNNGDYFSSSGRISYKSLNKTRVKGKYHCEEHDCMHTKKEIENTWLKTAALILPLLQYKKLGKRLESFNSWPSAKPTPKNLAAAGFFYSGQGDRVQCFYCAGIICQWDENDVPRKEHKRLFPSCPFIKKMYNQSHQTTENSKTSD